MSFARAVARGKNALIFHDMSEIFLCVTPADFVFERDEDTGRMSSHVRVKGLKAESDRYSLVEAGFADAIQSIKTLTLFPTIRWQLSGRYSIFIIRK